MPMRSEGEDEEEAEEGHEGDVVPLWSIFWPVAFSTGVVKGAGGTGVAYVLAKRGCARARDGILGGMVDDDSGRATFRHFQCCKG